MPRLVVLILFTCLFACAGEGNTGQDTSEDVLRDPADSGLDILQDTGGDTSTDVPVETGCTADSDCEDSNPCTDDICDTDYGTCIHNAVDEDADGYPAMVVEGTECIGGTDCDDSDANIHPDADLDCTGAVDMDCDGLSDPDEDEDGYETTECGGDDCDDADDLAFPGSMELHCDLDRDCNGQLDADNDDDGYDSIACGGDDCDDASDAINPGVSEYLCNGIDDNCNGEMSAEEDADHDGYANESCLAAGADVDCDDSNSDVYPGAPEVCDYVDNDCDGDWTDAVDADDDLDGYLDESCGGEDCDDSDETVFPGADLDGDGFEDARCGGDDCDDGRSDVHPDGIDLCRDGTDQDCDGTIDNGIEYTPEQRFTNAADHSRYSDIVWSGSVFGISWSDRRTGTNQIYFSQISATGAKIGTAVAVTSGEGSSMYPSIEWTGSSYGIAWSDTRDSGWQEIYFAAIDPTGTKIILDTRLTEDSALSQYPSIAWTGTNFGIAWDDTRLDSTSEIYFVRVGDNGSKIGSERRISASADISDTPSLVWTSSEFIICWRDTLDVTSEVYCSRISPEGIDIGIPTAISDLDGVGSNSPQAVWTSSELGVVWRDNRTSPPQAFFARSSADLTTVSSNVPVSFTSGATGDPNITWSGSTFAITWKESPKIYFALLNWDGTVLVPDAFVNESPASVEQPAIAGFDSVFNVVWQDTRDDINPEIYFRIIEPCF